MKKLIINESEKKEIRSLYNLSEQEDNFVTRMIKAALDGVEGKLKSSSTSSSDDKLSTDSVTNDSKPTGDTGKLELTGNFDSEQKKNIELMIDYMNKSNMYDIIGFTLQKNYIKQKTFLDLPVINFDTIEYNYKPDEFNLLKAYT